MKISLIVNGVHKNVDSKITKYGDSISVLIDDNIKEEVNNYTVNDYKKIIEMLNKIKKQGNSNISVDNIVALSLINNYDIDECLRFKDILNTIN